ncbi:MAG: hypothetical protein K8S98_01105 [Planctomycetes bacterium]|nr:hypothetical protein [Planctomycetota bacterium]
MSRSDGGCASGLRSMAVLVFAWAGWFASGFGRSLELAWLAALTLVVVFALTRERGRRAAPVLAFFGAAVAFAAYAAAPIPRSPVVSLVRIAAFGAAWLTTFPSDASAGVIRRVAARLVVALTTLVIVLGAAERLGADRLGERAVAIRPLDVDGPPDALQPDAELELRFVAGFRGCFDYPEFRSEPFETNADGFRDDPWPTTFSEGERRVLIVGDSMAAGWGVERRESFPALLARELEASNARIFNASVPSYGPRHERLLLERLWERVRPALVIATFYDGNDVGDVWRHFNVSRSRGITHLRPPSDALAPEERIAYVPDPRAPPLWSPRYWISYSRVCRRVVLELSGRYPWLGLRSPARPYSRDFLRSMRREPDAEIRDALRLSSASLIAMRDFARAHGARFCVVRIPAKIQVEPASLAQVFDELDANADEFDVSNPGARILADCAAASVDALDVFDALGAVDAASPANYFAEAHLNRAGHRRVATELGRFLRDGDRLR